MTREEEIKNFAQKLGQKYFPDCNNIWARPNIEAKYVTSACIEMAKWADEHPNLSEEEMVGMGGLGMAWQKKHLIDKACKWLELNTNWGDKWDEKGRNLDYGKIEEFRKAMEL